MDILFEIFIDLFKFTIQLFRAIIFLLMSTPIGWAVLLIIILVKLNT